MQATGRGAEAQPSRPMRIESLRKCGQGYPEPRQEYARGDQGLGYDHVVVTS